jgi:hypothetical protein
LAAVAAERDDPLLERDRALRARAAFAFVPEPLAEALLLRVLRAAGLLAADLALADLALADRALAVPPAADLPAAEVPRRDLLAEDLPLADFVLAIPISPGSRTSLTSGGYPSVYAATQSAGRSCLSGGCVRLWVAAGYVDATDHEGDRNV